MGSISATKPADIERPVLDLSGDALRAGIQAMVSGAEEHGGIERYVDAVKLKSTMFQQALENDVEVPRLLARGDRCAIEFREGLRKISEAVRQGVSFHDLGAHAEQDTLRAWLVILLRNRQQYFLQRQAGLRLDLPEDASIAIEAGDPDGSELMLRIVSEDEDERMPPPDRARPERGPSSSSPRAARCSRRWAASLSVVSPSTSPE